MLGAVPARARTWQDVRGTRTAQSGARSAEQAPGEVRSHRRPDADWAATTALRRWFRILWLDVATLSALKRCSPAPRLPPASRKVGPTRSASRMSRKSYNTGWKGAPGLAGAAERVLLTLLLTVLVRQVTAQQAPRRMFAWCTCSFRRCGSACFFLFIVRQWLGWRARQHVPVSIPRRPQSGGPKKQILSAGATATARPTSAAPLSLGVRAEGS